MKNCLPLSLAVILLAPGSMSVVGHAVIVHANPGDLLTPPIGWVFQPAGKI